MSVMEEKYTQYNHLQFATDPFFLQWRMTRDAASCQFWEKFRQDHPEKEEQIAQAIRIVQSIKLNPAYFSKEESLALLNQIQGSIRLKRRRKQNLWIRYTVAAGLLLLLSLPFLLRWSQPSTPTDILLSESLMPSQKIRLITTTQKMIELDRNSNIICQNKGYIQVKNEAKQQTYSQNNDTSGLNTLIVPYGMQTNLLLPDNSRIWVNAGTTVKFPSQFNDGKREIYAEGEVYLEVAKDSQHPFIVKTPFYKVKVLGTKFNISAYKADAVHAVVLAAGAIEVESPNSVVYPLVPNQKLTLGDNQSEISTVNPSDYTSWKEGCLQFSQDSLQNILSRLSRYYGIEIQFKASEQSLLTGKLVLFDDIKTVLDNISVITPITYTIQSNTIEVIQTP